MTRGSFVAISVKKRLWALFGCILAGFLLVFAVEYLTGRRLERTLELERLAVTARIETLEMRRQEKNYFLRHDPVLLALVGDHRQAAHRAIDSIRRLDPDNALSCDAALDLLDRYQAGFEEMAGKPDVSGLDPQAAAFLDRSRTLERLDEVSPELRQGLAAIARLEKRWLAADTVSTLRPLKEAVDTLLEKAGSSGPTAETLTAYREALAAYAGRIDDIGSTSAAFVAAARALEPRTEELRAHYEAVRRDIAATAVVVSAGIQVAILALVALAAWAVFRSVADPLSKLGRHARRVARGEATDLDPSEFSAEFGALAEDIGRMEKHLLATILDLARKEREAAEEAKRARDARKRAEDLSRVKSNFLSLVSHELKTPLTSMVGFAQVMIRRLERGPFADHIATDKDLAAECGRFHENLDIMLAEGRRLAGLIENVLELAALETKATPLSLHAVTAVELVDRAVEPFLATMEEKGLLFFRDLQADLPPLRCDRERMVYVLRHLFSNAVKFTDGGQIVCRARRDGDMAVISVEDTGRGIPPEMREAVFEKFLQLGDNLTDKMPGLGIGLAASRAVVEFHGGSIRIAGDQGQGSTVSISVPLALAA